MSFIFIDTRFNISSENNDFGFHSIKKINFSKTFPIQMHQEANLTLTFSRSRSSWDHHLNKLGRPHIPNATYQVLLVLEKKIFKRFLPYMGVVAIFVI